MVPTGATATTTYPTYGFCGIGDWPIFSLPVLIPTNFWFVL